MSGTKARGHWEDFATTTINLSLVELALDWQVACQRLKKEGKREKDARPARTTVMVPLKSTLPLENSMLARVSAGQHPSSGPVSVQNLDTSTLFTPPPVLLPSPVLSISLPPHHLGGCEVSFQRPYFKEESIKDWRRFSAWILSLNKSDCFTSIFLIQPSKRGRLEIYKNKSASTNLRNGGLTSIDPSALFKLAFARSKTIFEENGEGEQLFLAPRDGSRILLIDDLKTKSPIVDNTPFAILETSKDNFQHFYVCDRGLMVEERGKFQAHLVASFGGDRAATGGGQPHRCPGSVNYKPGRNLFVTRLIDLSSQGRPLVFPISFKASQASVVVSTPSSLASQEPFSGITSTYDQSKLDWSWVKRNEALGREELIRRLSISAAARGKHPDYARRTVDKVLGIGGGFKTEVQNPGFQ
jgi:hypothetical protein